MSGSKTKLVRGKPVSRVTPQYPAGSALQARLHDIAQSIHSQEAVRFRKRSCSMLTPIRRDKLRRLDELFADGADRSITLGEVGECSQQVAPADLPCFHRPIQKDRGAIRNENAAHRLK